MVKIIKGSFCIRMKFVFMLLILSSFHLFSFAQKKVNIPVLDMARMRMDPSHFRYDPTKGFKLYLSEAEKGNSLAMNAVGILYAEGTGTEQNLSEGVEWFKKSAGLGYPGACVNLGWCYARGTGVVQDFTKAFEMFDIGHSKKNAEASQGKGYLLYKGLGCRQDYKKAIELFKIGSKKGVLPSMYFLGLCYRNGYGTKPNIDSARYWLMKAHRYGYRVAKYELENPLAENAISTHKQKYPAQMLQSNLLLSNNQGASQAVNSEVINGEYVGYVYRFDWSGQYLINKTPLRITVDKTGNLLKCIWNEVGNSPTLINASLDGDKLKFVNSSYERRNQYSENKLIKFDFREANISVFKMGDSVYLSGNFRLWDNENKEPDRPMSIYLSRSNSTDFGIPKSGIRAFPNPFNDSFQVVIEMEKASDVQFIVSDMSGQIVSTNLARLGAGKQEYNIKLNVPVGSYVLKAIYDGGTKSLVLIKN